jgi:ubiquinol-cytochrome c reductase cytochrome c subunit
VKALAVRRRHPAATVVVLLLALLVTGGLYATLAPSEAEASTATSADDVSAGQDLFLANCATCHGLQAQGTNAGPSLIGVGAASVDFQVGTGRMPLAAQGVQAPQKMPTFEAEEVGQMAAYIASLAPGPAIPSEEYTTPVEAGSQEADERIAQGNELFRTNCAMCHNVVGAGGALTQGKYAPPLAGVEGEYVYEAMLTGPQSMPVFNDANITPEEKQNIISYLDHVTEEPSPGGLKLGSLGPVAEGLFVWVAALVVLVGCAVWLGTRSS